MQQFWINLPVKDIVVSRTFFEQIGFRPNPMYTQATQVASFFLGGNNVVMMLFTETAFSSLTQHKIADTNQGTEILLNIDAQSKSEVDAMAAKVRLAGGKIYAEPGEAEGWMYAFGFLDPDGHRWSMLYMDMEKMPRRGA